MVRYELPHVHGLNFVLDRALGWRGLDDAARRPARQVVPVARAGHRARLERGVGTTVALPPQRSMFVDGTLVRPARATAFTTVEPEHGCPPGDVDGSPTSAQADAGGRSRHGAAFDGGVWQPRPSRPSGPRCCAGSPTCWRSITRSWPSSSPPRSARRSRWPARLQTATPVVNFRWAADVAESGPRGGYREELPALAAPAPASRACCCGSRSAWSPRSRRTTTRST